MEDIIIIELNSKLISCVLTGGKLLVVDGDFAHTLEKDNNIFEIIIDKTGYIWAGIDFFNKHNIYAFCDKYGWWGIYELISRDNDFQLTMRRLGDYNDVPAICTDVHYEQYITDPDERSERYTSFGGL